MRCAIVEPARASGGFEDLIRLVPKSSDTIVQHMEFTKRVLEHLPSELETSQRVAPKHRGGRKRTIQETEGGTGPSPVLELMKKTLRSNFERLEGPP